ncbi:MAG: M81 family metallopeptidase, partial [Pseudomonadota bacterium]|nr:M81 family metallopeptidase [Pseudomonadota bacterium]
MASPTKAPRIAIGGFLHETNTFAPSKATLDDFRSGGGAGRMVEGADVIARTESINAGIAGVIEVGREAGWELIPTLFAATSPSAHVTEEAFEVITGRI